MNSSNFFNTLFFEIKQIVVILIDEKLPMNFHVLSELN
jgi:hypothetical protein